MLAVIETGGKQYLVRENQQIKIEKIKNLNEGEEVEFDKVLLFADSDKVLIGKPYLENVKVVGKIIESKRDKKIIVFKYHSKTRYRKKKGHRQPYMKVLIEKITEK